MFSTSLSTYRCVWICAFWNRGLRTLEWVHDFRNPLEFFTSGVGWVLVLKDALDARMALHLFHSHEGSHRVDGLLTSLGKAQTRVEKVGGMVVRWLRGRVWLKNLLVKSHKTSVNLRFRTSSTGAREIQSWGHDENETMEEEKWETPLATYIGGGITDRMEGLERCIEGWRGKLR